MTSSGSILLESMYNSAALAFEQADASQKPAILEMMDGLRMMLQREDQGWTPFYGGTDEGFQLAITLDQLKGWEKDLSELALGAAWMRRGLMLHCGYIWNGGIRYSPLSEGGSQGIKNVKKFFDDAENQQNFFGPDARRRRQSRLYYSGIVLYLGNEKTKKLTPIPLHQITDQILAPDGTGEIWAYKREWSERNLKTAKVIEKKEWIFTHRAIGHRVDKIKEAGAEETWTPVSQTERIFDMHANRLEGMAYGVPDALAAASWHKIAKNAFLDGITMTQALASFAFQVTNRSAKGGENAALQFATPQGAGQTIVGASELRSVNSAGSSYDFQGLTPVLAIMATSLDVSVIHLSASPGDAGSSYSAAETMDLPTRLAMGTRRDMHIEFDRQVLEWMGQKDPEVFFAPFESGTETYRNIQALILAAQAGAYSIEQLRVMIDDLLALPNGKPPTGALEFNNQKTLEIQARIAAKNAPKPAASDDSDGDKSSVASPAQGRGNGSGGQDGGNASNDLRDKAEQFLVSGDLRP
jgi:hypothetical protein